MNSLTEPPLPPPPSSGSPSSVGASNGTQAWRSTARLRTANWNTLPMLNCAIVCSFCWISESRVGSRSSGSFLIQPPNWHYFFSTKKTINKKKRTICTFIPGDTFSEQEAYWTRSCSRRTLNSQEEEKI